MEEIKEKTLKEWMLNQFEPEELRDIVNNGVDSGFSGLIYYNDTVHLFETFKDEIFDAIVDDADDMGYSNIYEFLATFNKAHMPENYRMFANQLIWYMAEKIAREETGE
jgi:hypothetical protein